jgi:hypothetical protein
VLPSGQLTGKGRADIAAGVHEHQLHAGAAGKQLVQASGAAVRVGQPEFGGHRSGRHAFGAQHRQRLAVDLPAQHPDLPTQPHQQ